MRASEPYCSCRVVRNWAGLGSSFVDRLVSFRRIFTCPLVQWCGSGSRLGPRCLTVVLNLSLSFCVREASFLFPQALEPCVLFVSESSLDSG